MCTVLFIVSNVAISQLAGLLVFSVCPEIISGQRVSLQSQQFEDLENQGHLDFTNRARDVHSYVLKTGQRNMLPVIKPL